MQWGSDSIWKILETNRWQEHDHNTRMAIHELFFGCVEHMLVSWGRVCKGGSEVAQSGRECSHRRTSHCCRDRFLSTFSCCTLCSLPKSCISTNQRCLCLTLLLCQYLLNFFFLSFVTKIFFKQFGPCLVWKWICMNNNEPLCKITISQSSWFWHVYCDTKHRPNTNVLFQCCTPISIVQIVYVGICGEFAKTKVACRHYTSGFNKVKVSLLILSNLP